ncbi:MAG: hypothetical protein JST11_27285 [Acidobacteria bacterium]|nr:hypothetical protein [Acidobacteriota bacterium]
MALMLPVMAAEPGVKTEVVGGTVSAIPQRTSVRLDLTAEGALHLRCAGSDIAIPFNKVNTLEYGQNVSRRYAAALLISPMFLLSKSRKHFVTLGYEDAAGKQQALVFRVAKGDIRAVLTGLEARTGRRVEYQDSEARKAGKG